MQTPVSTINSLKLIAESCFENSSLEVKKYEKPSPASKLKEKSSQASQNFSKVYVSLQAFKNQVYHGEFYRSDSKSKENFSLLNFKEWEKKIINSIEEKTLCLSDLKSFYHIHPKALKKLQIQKPKASAWILIKLALKQANWIQDWKQIQPNYMRMNL